MQDELLKVVKSAFDSGMDVIKLVLSQRVSGPDTTSVSGKKYRGLRFCILVGGENCGATRITEYNSKPVRPVCSECVAIVEKLRAKWLTGANSKLATEAQKNEIARKRALAGFPIDENWPPTFSFQDAYRILVLLDDPSVLDDVDASIASGDILPIQSSAQGEV